MTPTQLLVFASTPLVRVLFLTPLALILVDWLTGIARSVRSGTFQTKMLADFAHSNLMPYVMILLSFASALLAGVSIEAAFAGATTVVATFCAAQVGSIVENVAELSGFPSVTIETLLAGLLYRAAPEIEPQPNVQPITTSETPEAPATDASTESSTKAA